MRHSSHCGGVAGLAVDHFNPRLPNKRRHQYNNLVLACTMCNRAKSDSWPSRQEIAQGARFIDPTRELDYGNHLFEDPATGRLVATTAAGVYHGSMCDLNVTGHFKTSHGRSIQNQPVLGSI